MDDALDFGDRTDFDDADRGFIARADPGDRHDAGRPGRLGHRRLRLPRRASARTPRNPSLWRQGQLCAKQGLYEVTDGIYQVRGLDLSNMTIVEGDTRRHRHRPADLRGVRRRRARPLPRRTAATARSPA